MPERDVPKPFPLLLKRVRPGVADGRSRALVRMVAALDAAEAGARLEPGATRRLYQVNYRVGDGGSKLKGEPGVRRSYLVELIESRSPSERHLSTSTWLLRSFLRAPALADLLSAPLDVSLDFLSVSLVGSDRATFGDAGLRS